MAAEIIFHETAHLLIGPIMEAFSAELRAQGKFVTTGVPRLSERRCLACRAVQYDR